jgi:hypothetical protein
MPKMRVRVQRQKQTLVHNDLSNAGYYFYKRIATFTHSSAMVGRTCAYVARNRHRTGL